MQNTGKMIIIGIIGLILTGIGVSDLLFTSPNMLNRSSYNIVGGEESTVNYYFFIGIPLLILSIVSLARNRGPKKPY